MSSMSEASRNRAMTSKGALAIALAIGFPMVAHAQERGSKLEAELATQPDLPAVGARIGAFQAFVGGTATAVYDDNIYAQETGKVDDVYFKISPNARIVSDSSNYKLSASAGLDRYEYNNRGSESRTDWNLNSDVVVEFLRDTTVTLNGGFRRATEERGAPDSPVNAVSPVRYEAFTAGGGLAREVGRLQARTVLDYQQLNYDDGRQGNGVIINNDDRDRKTLSGGGELSFAFSPGYRIFGRALLDQVWYRLPLDDTGFNRDAKGYRLTGGLKMDLTNVIEGQLFAGYMHRNYKDPRFDDYSGIAYGASIRWAASRLTTIRLSANRDVQETTQVGYRGYISTDVGFRVEHDLTRAITLRGSARYAKNRYLLSSVLPVGFAALRRDDDLYFVGAGLDYTLNRQFAVGVSWDYAKRSSNAPTADYARNKVLGFLRVTL
jgi:hypothetical protein